MNKSYPLFPEHHKYVEHYDEEPDDGERVPYDRAHQIDDLGVELLRAELDIFEYRYLDLDGQIDTDDDGDGELHGRGRLSGGPGTALAGWRGTGSAPPACRAPTCGCGRSRAFRSACSRT